MTRAPAAAASARYFSWSSIIDSLSPVQLVWTMAARTSLMTGTSRVPVFPIRRPTRPLWGPILGDCDGQMDSRCCRMATHNCVTAVTGQERERWCRGSGQPANGRLGLSTGTRGILTGWIRPRWTRPWTMATACCSGRPSRPGSPTGMFPARVRWCPADRWPVAPRTTCSC